jgi:hypothetical protein
MFRGLKTAEGKAEKGENAGVAVWLKSIPFPTKKFHSLRNKGQNSKLL